LKTLFVDENLPKALGYRLAQSVIHATDLGTRPSDQEIWDRGKEEDWIILTQDADFFDRLIVDGPPPRVVWVRTGNLRRRAMEDLLVRVWPAVERLLDQASLIEIHNDRIEGISFDPTLP
jgi:predicted nuclease of predicted toxin-antitoxin system